MKDMTIFSSELKLLRKRNFFKGDKRFWGDKNFIRRWNYFEGIELTDDMFLQDTLNDFISDGKKTWRLVRNRIAEIFDEKNPKLRDNSSHRDILIFKIYIFKKLFDQNMIFWWSSIFKIYLIYLIFHYHFIIYMYLYK